LPGALELVREVQELVVPPVHEFAENKPPHKFCTSPKLQPHTVASLFFGCNELMNRDPTPKGTAALVNPKNSLLFKPDLFGLFFFFLISRIHNSPPDAEFCLIPKTGDAQSQEKNPVARKVIRKVDVPHFRKSINMLSTGWNAVPIALRQRTTSLNERKKERAPTSLVTEHILHRDYCPSSKKLVEPTVSDALPGALVFQPVSQILKGFNSHLHFSISTRKSFYRSKHYSI